MAARWRASQSSRAMPSALYLSLPKADRRSPYGDFSADGYISYCRASQGSPWATRSTDRVLSSASGAPVSTKTFHGWTFDPDGDQAAADNTRSSTSLDTGSSVNPRTARRLVTASYTSVIAYLTPAMKHRGTNATSLDFI